MVTRYYRGFYLQFFKACRKLVLVLILNIPSLNKICTYQIKVVGWESEHLEARASKLSHECVQTHVVRGGQTSVCRLQVHVHQWNILCIITKHICCK